jgi:hypothetical protein
LSRHPPHPYKGGCARDAENNYRKIIGPHLNHIPHHILKRYGASRPVTTGNFSIHHRTARAVPRKVGGIGLTPSERKVPSYTHATNTPAAPDGLVPSELKVPS